MCGRYDFFPGEFTDLRIRFNLPKDLLVFKPCYNIAPGKDVPVIVRHGDRNVVKLMRWGLVPSWARLDVREQLGLRANIMGHRIHGRISVYERR